MPVPIQNERKVAVMNCVSSSRQLHLRKTLFSSFLENIKLIVSSLVYRFFTASSTILQKTPKEVQSSFCGAGSTQHLGISTKAVCFRLFYCSPFLNVVPIFSFIHQTNIPTWLSISKSSYLGKQSNTEWSSKNTKTNSPTQGDLLKRLKRSVWRFIGTSFPLFSAINP